MRYRSVPKFSQSQLLDIERLGLDTWHVEDAYDLYVRRGHKSHDAFAHALAKVANMKEQKRRRAAHGTGCER